MPLYLYSADPTYFLQVNTRGARRGPSRHDEKDRLLASLDPWWQVEY